MRKDTSFTDRQLTEDEFSQKYWKGGEFPYQYHTASVIDGRDEREQFLFNNVRALYELQKNKYKSEFQKISDMDVRVKKLEKRIVICKKINIAILLMIIALLTLRERMNL